MMQIFADTKLQNNAENDNKVKAWVALSQKALLAMTGNALI